MSTVRRDCWIILGAKRIPATLEWLESRLWPGRGSWYVTAPGYADRFSITWIPDDARYVPR